MQQAGSRRWSEKPCICRSTCLLVQAHAEPGAMLAQDFSALAAVNACAQLLLCGGSSAGSVSCAASCRCLQAASPEKATTLVRIGMDAAASIATLPPVRQIGPSLRACSRSSFLGNEPQVATLRALAPEAGGLCRQRRKFMLLPCLWYCCVADDACKQTLSRPLFPIGTHPRKR